MTQPLLNNELMLALTGAAGAASLMVATDFDGTIAELQDDPTACRPAPSAALALSRLAGMPATRAVVLSGRGLQDLSACLVRGAGCVLEGVVLLGCYGAERAHRPLSLATSSALALTQVARHVALSIASVPGACQAWIEHKPASIAVHVRRAERSAQRAVMDAARAAAAGVHELTVVLGKDVVEVFAGRPCKGRALDELRQETGAQRVVYLGDDRADEAVFAGARAGDVMIKVGPGHTEADHRVADVREAAAALSLLARKRAEIVRA